MTTMDWFYLVTGAGGFLLGIGIAWGASKKDLCMLRRDIDRLREDHKDAQRANQASIRELLILRLKNGHGPPKNGNGD